MRCLALFLKPLGSNFLPDLRLKSQIPVLFDVLCYFFCFVVSCCAFDASKSYPRGSRGFSGSLCGALVSPTRPKNHQTTLIKSMILAFCSMLLHFLSMLVPRAILGAVVACWALFLEPFWNVGLSIPLSFSGCVCFGFQASRLVYETRHSLNSRKPLRTRRPMV